MHTVIKKNVVFQSRISLITTGTLLVEISSHSIKYAFSSKTRFIVEASNKVNKLLRIKAVKVKIGDFRFNAF